MLLQRDASGNPTAQPRVCETSGLRWSNAGALDLDSADCYLQAMSWDGTLTQVVRSADQCGGSTDSDASVSAEAVAALRGRTPLVRLGVNACVERGRGCRDHPYRLYDFD